MRTLVLTLALAIPMLSTGAMARFRVEAGLSYVPLHPQVMANDNYGMGKQLSWMISRRIDERTSAGLSFSASKYPFINKESDVQSAPGTGIRPGEHGEGSLQYELAGWLLWTPYGAKRNLEILRFLPRFGAGLGIGYYYEGKRGWKRYVYDGSRPNGYYIEEVIIPGGWRTPFLKANLLFDFEVLRFQNFEVRTGWTGSLQLTRLKVKDYAQAISDAGIGISLGYSL